MAIDDSGNLYIIDEQNVVVRKVSADGIITTIAGIAGHVGFNGDSIMATDALLSQIEGITVDKQYNVYIADAAANRIRKILPSGLIITIAGTGIAGYNGDGIAANTAQINYPTGICIDRWENIYIAEDGGYRIRKIDPTGIISTVAGNGIAGYGGDGGPATAAMFTRPYRVCVDTAGTVYTSDGGTRIRKISTDGIISTIAGNGSTGFLGDGGPATMAQFNGCAGIKIDKWGNIYIADFSNAKVRKIDVSGTISTIAGQYSTSPLLDGTPATSGALASPEGVEVDSNGNIYITELNVSRIRKTYIHTVNVPLVPITLVTLFPNPNNGTFNISLPALRDNVEITIYDALGQQVYRNEKKQVQHLLVQTELLNGVYYVKIITQDEISTQQITINN